MEKRTAQEKEKYQPSYDTTILSEVSVIQNPNFNVQISLNPRLIPPEWLLFILAIYRCITSMHK